jgi:hypothetical protein
VYNSKYCALCRQCCAVQSSLVVLPTSPVPALLADLPSTLQSSKNVECESDCAHVKAYAIIGPMMRGQPAIARAREYCYHFCSWNVFRGDIPGTEMGTTLFQSMSACVQNAQTVHVHLNYIVTSERVHMFGQVCPKTMIIPEALRSCCVVV